MSDVEKAPVTGAAMMSQWDAYADRLRVQLPAAPEGLLAWYVKWVPWLAIVFGAIGALLLLPLLGLAGVLSGFAVMAGYSGGSLVLNVLFSLVLAVLQIVGGYMMLKMRITGWWLLAAGLIVNLLNSLIHASLVGLLIGLLIAYIHLLVKPRYT